MVSVGVLVNPIAGFGGMLAMHGTDRLPDSRFDEAVREGRAEGRLLRALQRFAADGAAAELVAAPGLLGAHQLGRAGIHHRALAAPVATGPTSRQDTMDASRRLVEDGVDVLLFAGGDGTATDIAEAVGTSVVVVGVPSGVKMHSEVFARSPESAGRLLADFVSGDTATEEAEVLDVGDDASGIVGMLLVPRSRDVLQGAKTSGPAVTSAVAAHAVASELVAEAPDDVTWILGPGSTAAAVADELGFAATLRGVDVRHPGGEIELDVAEPRLHEIAKAARQPRLVLGVVGGQGFLLGRGNQQLSARVIGRIGAERIEIVASAEKVGALSPPVLYVDADGPGDLVGYRRVRTGAKRSTVLRVVDAAAETATS